MTQDQQRAQENVHCEEPFGAPRQLLQHHLDIADQWPDKQADAMELIVKNLHGTMHVDG